MKIVGEEWISKEFVVKELKTKNAVRQTVRREMRRYIVLECGHKAPAKRFVKVPEHETRCLFCNPRVPDEGLRWSRFFKDEKPE